MLPEDANNAKNFAEVTVKSDAVEKVTEAKLSNDLTYVTMNDKTVEFKATKGINGLGKEVLPKEGETALGDEDVSFERAVSSDSTVAYVEGGKIVPLKAGNVTFDVYFTNVKEPVKVTVEVKAAQEATSMEKIENMKVQTGGVTLPEVKVLDQYGKAMKATPVIKVTDKDNKEVQVSQGNKVSLTEAGKYTVKVFASDAKDAKQLGSYTIETVKVDEKTKPEVYELNFTKDAKDKVQDTLDIEGTNQSVVIDVVGKVDGVKVATDKFHKGLDAKTSDEAVEVEYDAGKITVTFKEDKTPKVGDVTITLYNKEGAMVTDLQTATVKVVNTAAQIEELKLADEKATALTAVVDDAKALKDADVQGFFTKEKIADQLTAGKDADEKEIFNAKMVKEVKFIERVLDEEKGKLTGKVHVTLDAKYGGKTFVFDAEVTIKEVPTEPEVPAEADLKAELATATKDINEVTLKNIKEPITSKLNGEVTTALKAALTPVADVEFNVVVKTVGELTEAGTREATYEVTAVKGEVTTTESYKVTVKGEAEVTEPTEETLEFTATASVVEAGFEIDLTKVKGTLGTDETATVTYKLGEGSEKTVEELEVADSKVTVKVTDLVAGKYTGTIKIAEATADFHFEVTKETPEQN